ncbi:Sulfatase [Seinonella peptonophila]|uniref:Sulfatase n=1 Tax=Seinonella peptonophila TaxID=112248 RepID=A0A1M4YM10_9BACL|nr:alkaline phosphatase family protein [Seinonella peptonophila]SHF06542.1 Sulfatase [Seinonella peptonophila]
MKSAPTWEKVGARIWNVLNEGKPFTPVFVVGTFISFQLLFGSFHLISLLWAFFCVVPLLILYACFEFPLKLRWYLWPPLVFFIGSFGGWHLGLQLWALVLYFFFTIIFWGSIYYHWRIGIPLDNYKRFWRLVLVHSDSTSGNAQEQLPKFMLLLAVLQWFYIVNPPFSLNLSTWFYLLFLVLLFFYSVGVHHFFFHWRPAEPEQWTRELAPVPKEEKVKRVVMVVIDGCRADRLAEANTPFIDKLQGQGAVFTQMETIYPARTVVCFSSIFTGAYPRDHGITSNFVWRQGVRCESIFDQLRKKGKQGKLLAIAHLLEAFGNDVEAMSAVVPNDEIDGLTIERAKQLMDEQDWNLFAVQLIAVDQTGHSRGALYDEYLAKIEEADRHVGAFYQWLEQAGYLEDAVFILCADHGQSDGIGGHAHLDEGERYPPFLMVGKGIREGVTIDTKVNLTSITPTICYLLGVPYPDHARGQILQDALVD